MKQPITLLATLALSASIGTFAQAELPTGFDAAQSSGISSVSTVGTTQTITTNAVQSVGSFNTFNISQGHTVNVQQPTNTSSFLAMVRDTSRPTTIFGQLNSNGQVGVVNAAGIFVGAQGVINTQGLVLTTHQLDTNAFLTGQGFQLTHNGSRRNARVRNDGTITVGGDGMVLLAAPRVINRGTITTAGGSANLVSAKQVAVATTADGQTLRLDLPTTFDLNDNNPFSGVVNNSGVVQVNQLSVTPEGAINLVSTGGRVDSKGTLNAQGDVTVVANSVVRTRGSVVSQGGNVTLSGKRVVARGTVEAAETARFTASDNWVYLADVSANSIEASAARSLTVGGKLDAADTVSLTAGRNLTLRQTANAGSDITLTAGRNLQTRKAITSGGNLKANAGRNLVTRGEVTAATNITLKADRTINTRDTLTSTAGNIKAEAGKHVRVRDDVTASNGSVTFITENGDVSVGRRRNPIEVEGLTDITFDGGDDTFAFGNFNTQGELTLKANDLAWGRGTSTTPDAQVTFDAPRVRDQITKQAGPALPSPVAVVAVTPLDGNAAELQVLPNEVKAFDVKEVQAYQTARARSRVIIRNEVR